MRPRLLTGILFFSLTLLICSSMARSAGNTIKKVDLDTFDGIILNASTRTMVVAMAAWCKPCREEIPTLEKLHQKYRQTGLSMVGLSLDSKGPDDLQSLLDKHGVTFPVYWAGDAVTKKYKIFGVPMTLLIKHGKIVEKIPGQRSEKYLKKKIDKLLESE